MTDWQHEVDSKKLNDWLMTRNMPGGGGVMMTSASEMSHTHGTNFGVSQPLFKGDYEALMGDTKYCKNLW